MSTESTPATTTPTINIHLHVDLAPFAAVVESLVERILKLDPKP